MNRIALSTRLGLSVVLAVAISSGCSPVAVGDAEGAASSGNNAGDDRARVDGSGGMSSTGPTSMVGEADGAVGGARATGGVGGEKDDASGDSGDGSSDAAGVGTDGSGATAKDSGAHSCNVPARVSFQKDVQTFLIPSCGGGNGCHVIDSTSTMGSGGFNHAYDWITAGAHTFSCPTGPKRFEVVIAVINAANPPSCSHSRKMPPPDAIGDGLRAPLSGCQVSTLQAWLDEPLVTQIHRADDTSPTTPYPMPPFN